MHAFAERQLDCPLWFWNPQTTPKIPNNDIHPPTPQTTEKQQQPNLCLTKNVFNIFFKNKITHFKYYKYVNLYYTSTYRSVQSAGSFIITKTHMNYNTIGGPFDVTEVAM